MSVPLHQILALVGRLDDAPGEDTPRERFRRFLRENVQTVGVARDYLEECLRESGEQYSRALQDLANRLGHFLGFEVTFGRYQGTQGAIGFDGLWSSPRNFHIVVEVKTTEVYPIKAATLVNYIDELISEKRIPNWEHALGLYVIGRPQEGIYGFGERTPGRKHIKPGDWICFYATGKGVIAHARVSSLPEKMRHPKIRHPDKYNWIVQVRDAHLYLDRPVVIDAALRSQLEAFEGRDPNTSSWAWFVQATRRISRHDYYKLTCQEL
ncbi:MAG TPA: hypothetical protein VNK95_02145 [Caldilineaceae bacterium]|nr:hypothetical protein [Caldilineaceae bacterium]